MTKDDQDKINAFSRLFNRSKYLEEELEAKKVSLDISLFSPSVSPPILLVSFIVFCERSGCNVYETGFSFVLGSIFYFASMEEHRLGDSE